MKTMVHETARSAFALAIAGLVAFTALSLAEAKTSAPEYEEKLSTEIMLLNNDAKIPDGGRIAADHLVKEFDVSHERISALQGRGLDYGEIAAVLGMAEKMDGGVNEENVGRIMELRKGDAPWPQVASAADVDLGDVANRVSQVEDNVHRGIKSAAGGQSTSGTAAGGTSGTTTTSPERDVGTAGADY